MLLQCKFQGIIFNNGRIIQSSINWNDGIDNYTADVFCT